MLHRPTRSAVLPVLKGSCPAWNKVQTEIGHTSYFGCSGVQFNSSFAVFAGLVNMNSVNDDSYEIRTGWCSDSQFSQCTYTSDFKYSGL